MTRKQYIERRLVELSLKEDKDILDIQEEKDLTKELEDIFSKNTKKESYKLPPTISMYDMCYCIAKCSAPCGRRQKPNEKYFTASDFTQVCSDYTRKD